LVVKPNTHRLPVQLPRILARRPDENSQNDEGEAVEAEEDEVYEDEDDKDDEEDELHYADEQEDDYVGEDDVKEFRGWQVLDR
jgi:hypothetical protein